MKKLIQLSMIAAGFAFATAAQSAVAGDITDLLRRPVQAVNPYIPLIDVSTAVPTTNDILALPLPSRKDRTVYPLRVVRYGLNIYPSARVARRNGLMLIEF